MDTLLSGGDVIGQAIAADGSAFGIKDGKTGTVVVIARLPDTSDVKEVFMTGLDVNVKFTFFGDICTVGGNDPLIQFFDLASARTSV